MKKIKPYFTQKDQRGSIIGLFQGYNWKEINFITSKKNIVRGNHYHKKTLEGFFIISGEIKVSIKNLKTNKISEFTVKPTDCFIIKPYEIHTFKINKNSTWINLLTAPINQNKPDIWKI